ncbi:unnamed protein product, partial [Durusdinium trenchii]
MWMPPSWLRKEDDSLGTFSTGTPLRSPVEGQSKLRAFVFTFLIKVFTAELPGAARICRPRRGEGQCTHRRGTFVNWCACGFLAMWAFMKPRESARITTRILYFLTFAIYAGGLGFYTSAANNLKDLPPMGEQ